MGKETNLAGAAGERRLANFKRLIYDGLVGGDMNAIDEVVVRDLVDHQLYGPGFPPGREGVRALTVALLIALPDMKSDIEEIVFFDNESWARIRTTGTFTGSYLGIPPTGKPIDIHVVESVRWTADDRVEEHWGVADRFKLLEDMALIPPEYVPTWRPEVGGDYTPSTHD